MSKKYLIIGGILILIATMGFLFLGVYESVMQNEKENLRYIELELERYSEIVQQLENMYYSILLHSEHELLLYELKPKSKMAESIEKNYVKFLMIGLNNLDIFNKRISDSVTIKNFDKLTFEELVPVYSKLSSEFTVETKIIAEKVKTQTKKIYNMENTRFIYFKWISIINSFGLFLIVLSNYLKNK